MKNPGVSAPESKKVDFIGRLGIRQIDIFNNTVLVDLETISGLV